MSTTNTEFKEVNLENESVQRILAAALACWSRDGYHGSSLKDIAAEAGVAKSLLHYHFSSKEHLLIELQAHTHRRVANQIRERLKARGPSIEGALEALDQCWEALAADAGHFPFTLEVWRASLSNGPIRERLEAFRAEMQQLIYQGIVDALGPYTKQMTLAPDRLARLLMVAFEGFSLHLWLSGEQQRLRRVFEDFKMLVRRAVLPADVGN